MPNNNFVASAIQRNHPSRYQAGKFAAWPSWYIPNYSRLSLSNRFWHFSEDRRCPCWQLLRHSCLHGTRSYVWKIVRVRIGLLWDGGCPLWDDDGRTALQGIEEGWAEKVNRQAFGPHEEELDSIGMVSRSCWLHQSALASKCAHQAGFSRNSPTEVAPLAERFSMAFAAD